VQEINLYQLLKFYASKWPWIVVLTVVGALAGYTYNTYVQTPLYKSDATLLIIDDQGKATKDSTLINNYIELIKSRRVLEPVIANSNHVLTYDEFAAATTATTEKDTEVIKISVATKSAQTSKSLTDGLVASFQDQIKDIYDKDNVTVVDKANLPDAAFNVHLALYLGLAASGGFLLAVIILFFAYDFKLTKQAIQEETAQSVQPEIKNFPQPEEKENMALKFSEALPMPPTLDKPLIADEEMPLSPSAPVSAKSSHSFVRRTMRALVGLTLGVSPPPRPPSQENNKKAN
jgi:capsular polysaccharide biosynthesis protein